MGKLPFLTVIFFLIMIMISRHVVKGGLKCSGGRDSGDGNPGTTDTIFDFGEPIMFVTSQSQKFDEYSLVDEYKRTSIFHEYLMLGYQPGEAGTTGIVERLKLVLYDGAKVIRNAANQEPDLVHQNLEKELYWRYFNSTGVYPWLAIVNTTTMTKIPFYSSQLDDEANGISYVARLVERNYFYDPQIPFDAVFEIPGNSRVLRTSKTMIQYQSFSLWRHKLSNKTVEWAEVNQNTVKDSDKKSLTADFIRIENPCTKDMFLLYSARSDGSKDHLYLASPLIQIHLEENWFYDMATEDHPWSPDIPQDMVLTNDHFIVLTNNSLWISESLNYTDNEIDMRMQANYTEKPSLKYSLVDPCSGYEQTIPCFNHAIDDVPIHVVHQLFYNPVCYLFQITDYHDYLVFTAKNEIEKNVYEFTVLYAGTPYKDWMILFSNVIHYKRYLVMDGNEIVTHYLIRDIIGIFYNHHIDQFDISIRVKEILHDENVHMNGSTKAISTDGDSNGTTTVDEDQDDEASLFIRFSLRRPRIETNRYGALTGYRGLGKVKNELDGVMGKGFADYLFPKHFKLERVVVGGDSQDVFFLGNQLWIAEGGGSFPYPTLTGLTLESPICSLKKNASEEDEVDLNKRNYRMIRECSFNHPDRTYVCMNEDRNLLIAGRIGSTYSPIVTKIEEIEDLRDIQEINAWSSKYVCDVVQKRAVFVSGYSGKIIMWYMFEPEVASQETSTFLSNPENDPVCQLKTKNNHLCKSVKKFATASCTSEPVGKPGFRMLAIDPAKLKLQKLSTDGPLVPVLIDAAQAVLFEGIVPQAKANDTNEMADRFNYNIYLSEVNVGQKIYCNNYDLLKKDASNPALEHNCEMFIRHIKSVEGYLPGFRSSVFVTLLRSIPMLPTPADIVVLVLEGSNRVIVKINDNINNEAWTFNEQHIGQTLYYPGSFSILLSSFPDPSTKSIMSGFTTLYHTHEYRAVYPAFHAFLIDMSTTVFRKTQLRLQGEAEEAEKERFRMINEKASKKREAELTMRMNIDKMYSGSLVRKANQNRNISGLNGTDNQNRDTSSLNETDKIVGGGFFRGKVPPLISREDIEKELLTLKESEQSPIEKGPKEGLKEPSENDLWHGKIDYKKKRIWHLDENDCDYAMSLSSNPVLKSHGGRISLDLNDRVSYEVQLKSKTRIGKLMMYRPLLVVTNSNPNVLRVEKTEKLAGDPQYVRIMLAPTGFARGVAVISVRSMASSMKCDQTTSVTFIVLVHRDVGRRLHVEPGIPTCKPSGQYGMYRRVWYKDVSGCITREELLSTDPDIKRYRDGRELVIYTTLPANYRPPSFDGADIPKAKNIYNADPSKPPFKTTYKVSKETFNYELCKGAKNKSECACSDNDRLINDEYYTECKEKVFYTPRTGGSGTPLTMYATYDRLMRDEDQDQELFVKKEFWSVTIEEVNGRSEWFVISPDSEYLTEVNSNVDLNEGSRHYDMDNFKVHLLGTGLFHFKVTLGRFESFDAVTGYVILYVDPTEMNHVHLFMILMGTIIFCITVVFIGFLLSRKRLSSLLPIQPTSHKIKLKLM